MKNKIIKTSLILIGIVLIIFGITKIVKYDVTAIQGSIFQTKASTGAKIVAGKDPNGYSYKIQTGTWDALYGENSLLIAEYPGYQIYCSTYGSGIRVYPVDTSDDFTYADAQELEGEEYTSGCVREGHAETPDEGRITVANYIPQGESDLSPGDAYIVSHNPIGNWSEEKQNARWNMTGGGSKGSSSLDGQAASYEEYDPEVRGNGLRPEDKTSLDSVLTKVNQTSGKYTVGPFNIDYTNGIYGNIAFAGISEMTVTGYNKDGAQVKEGIEIESFILDGAEKSPEYFEADGTLLTDESEQVYPEPGQDFEIVFSDPNSGLDVNDPNRVASISIKVKFQYMLATGKSLQLEGTKYEVTYEHDESYSPHTCYVYDGTHWEEYDDEGNLINWGYNYDAEECHGCKTKCVLKPAGQQPLEASDAIRTLYEEEFEIGKSGGGSGIGIDITMEIGGNVWEDQRDGKETLPNGQNDGESAVANIPVLLYTEDGTFVEETTTDGSGEYKFEELDAMKKYYVEFQYNGQQYENTIYTDNLSDGYSNATESTDDRDEFNQRFEEIDGDEGYTIDQLDSYLPDVAPNFDISAYTGKDGLNDKKVYPIYDVFVVAEHDQVVAGVKYEAIYEDGDSQKEVDFGIVKRIEFDIALKKDVYAATVKINAKTEVYGYDKKNLSANAGSAGDEWNINIVGGYDRGFDNADYNFTGQNGNNQLLEVYVTYKIAVRNQSQTMLGHVTKLYDYYDSTYEYVEALSWKSNDNKSTNTATLDELQNSMEAGSTSSWGDAVGASDDGGKLTIDVGKKQSSGETVYLYLTFKVNGEGPNLVLGEKTNSAEIGAFKTYYKDGTVLPHYGENSYTVSGDDVIAGRVDKDSIPSSMKAGGTPTEDDEDEAPGLNVHLTGDSRKLNGTVWEDERTEASEQSVIGNGLKDDGETGIAGVKVQLVEKTVQGTEYLWQETKTDSNGAYNFDGYIAGDYVVRFIYGDSTDTVATKANGGQNDVSYNGQDFKSTNYQVDVTQNVSTDLDGVYKGYTSVDVQNETGTYGYDIAEAESKNVSDAKDIWSRRQEVNLYSTENVINDVAEVLASPYSGDTSLLQELINNTQMTAETGVIVVEVEKNMQSNLENGQPSYSLLNIDLGLVERPKAQLEIDKAITNVKVTLANGSVLFDANQAGTDVIWKDHEEYNLGSKKEDGKYEDYYGNKEGKNRYSYREEVDKLVGKTDKGLIQLTMDEELMHGATIQMTYNLKVTNVGEVDYTGQEFYYLGTGGTEDNKVTTTANQVVDYVANNLKFDKSKNSDWEIIKGEQLLSDGLVNERLKSTLIDDTTQTPTEKFNNIIYTEKLNKALKPATYEGDKITNTEDSVAENTLVLTQLISTENTSDDLTYSNIVEIVKTSNTVGRRMAYSVVGNQDPTADEAAEVDTSLAEKVIILPPFGNTHILYALIAVIGIILIAGITFTIKKVMKK